MKDVNLLLQHGVNVQKSLELFGDMETYDETLADFLQDIEERLQQLKAFKEVADMGNYSILVHALKSDARYFGFDVLGDMCYQHEEKSRANDIYYVYEHYDELIKEFKQMIQIGLTYLGKQREVAIDHEKVTVATDKTILVVDDSDIIQKFIQKLFMDQYQVVTASDGEEALRIIVESNQYDIVGMLLDLNMPHVDGFTVLDYFQRQQLFTKIPVSIITGIGNDDEVKKAFQYPIIDVLQKPFNERDIKIIVDKMIAK